MINNKGERVYIQRKLYAYHFINDGITFVLPVLMARFYFEFNLNALLRGDSKSMAEAFAIGRQWGWWSVNDIRRLLNANKIENGDIYLQPMNMIEAGEELPVKKDNKMIEDIQALIEGRN